VKKDLSAAACVALVVLAYGFFASGGTWKFRPIQWFQPHSESLGADYYARLAEGFRTGHLYMAASVDPRFETLKNPYDYDQRMAAGVDGLWDASYYRGHYYLYHSAVPAVIFYLPYRLIRGAYPPDPLAAVFFCSWAFLMAVLFLMRALPRNRIAIWVLVAGLANVIVFLLPDIRVYEVAVMTAMAMSMTWAWALLRFVERPGTSSAVWMGVFLALSVAARPNLIVLIVPTLLALYAARDRQPLLRIARAALLPIVISTAILWSYNFARFGSPFELGVTYQMEFTSMQGKRVCSICNTKEVLRFVNNAEHYLLWPVSIDSRFPYVSLQTSRLDPAVSAPLGADTILGIIAMLPLVIPGAFFALMLGGRRDAEGARRVMLGGWLTLAALSTCWWIVARYSLDFTMLIAVSSIVCIERGLALCDEWGVRTRLLRLTITSLAVYSILVGLLLGFEGLGGSFRRVNPELYQKIGHVLHVKVRS